MQGIIHLNKQKNITSHSCVSKIKKLLNIKCGHSGTLDPMAEGVLNIYLGNSTKFIDIVKSDKKKYIATFKFGYTSDTLDIWGNVKKVESKTMFSPQELKNAEDKFRGKIKQIPPMYAAIKYNGKKLYEYARLGQEIERKPRIVSIDDISIKSIVDSDEYVISLFCSKGTYVRSLIDDIGRYLNSSAIMTSLIRTENDFVSLDQTYTFEEIEDMLSKGDRSFIKKIDEFLPFREVCLSDVEYSDLIHGRKKYISTDFVGQKVKLIYNNEFVGIAGWNNSSYTKEKII